MAASPKPIAGSWSPTRTRGALLSGAFSLFFLSFVMLGDSNVVPQLFFQHYYPGRKTLLLSISLLIATTAATIAVSLPGRFRPSRIHAIFALLLTTLVMVVLYSTEQRTIFIPALVFIQFMVNYLTNSLDYEALARAGDFRRFNDGSSMGGRLFGSLAAPLFLTLFYEKKWILLPSSITLGLLATVGVAWLLLAPIIDERVEAETRRGLVDLSSLLLFGFAFSIYMDLYLFGANIIYIARDMLHFRNPDAKGGIAIVSVFAAAVVVNASISVAHRKSADSAPGKIRLVRLAPPILPLTVFGAMLALGIRVSYSLFLIGSSLLGASYGAFLWEVRDYSSKAVQSGGNNRLIAWFNNLGNISALGAFLLMLIFSVFTRGAHAKYYILVTTTIAAIPLGGLVPLLASQRFAQSA